ncbi:MAG: class I SAM-dependent methyltransferase [Acidobacteriota bacterium]
MPDESHPVVDAFLADQLTGDAALERTIDRRDYMWRFAMDQRSDQRDLALLDYFRGGLSVERLVRRALAWRFGAREDLRLLDFAAGCGRATRYLVRQHGAERITAADILPEAVAFLRQTFGIETFASATRPDDVVCDQPFDAIVSASFFSHLPQATFEPWLRRLYGMLAPGGLLIFSVHGEDAWSGALDANGFSYLQVSEIDELSTEDYGIAQVSESFMARAIAAASGGQASYRRLRRGLWTYQDVYLVTTDSSAAASEIQPGEPAGQLYGAEHPESDPCQLQLHGWATDLNGSEVERIEVVVNGATAGVTAPAAPLPEIAADLGQPELAVAGWSMVVQSPRGRFDPRDVILIKVVSRSGESYVIHGDTLRGLLVTDALARLRERSQQVEQLERQLAQMRQSRFWKLRETWWDLRHRLGSG